LQTGYQRSPDIWSLGMSDFRTSDWLVAFCPTWRTYLDYGSIPLAYYLAHMSVTAWEEYDIPYFLVKLQMSYARSTPVEDILGLEDALKASDILKAEGLLGLMQQISICL